MSSSPSSSSSMSYFNPVIKSLPKKITFSSMPLNPFSKFFFFFLISSLVFFQTNADIEMVFLENDARSNIILNRFGFSETGYISVNISDVSITSSASNIKPNMSRIGLVVMQPDYLLPECLLDNLSEEYIYIKLDFVDYEIRIGKSLLTFDDLHPPTPPSSKPSLNKTTHVNITTFHDIEGDQRKPEIVLINCNPNTYVSMKVHLATYNLDSSGTKNYLSTSEVPAIAANFILALCHAFLLVIWIILCLKQISNVYMVHILMGVLLFVKSVNLFYVGKELQYVNVFGHSSPVWGTLIDASQLLRGILFVCVFTLIATGWQIIKPCLQDREKILLGTGLILQFIANVGFMVLKEISAYIINESYGWVILFVLLDIVSSTITFWPIKWQMESLKDSAAKDGKAAANLRKLKMLFNLVFAVMIYLDLAKYMPLVIMSMNGYAVNWSMNAISETGALVLYGVTFYYFQPHPATDYLSLVSEEEEQALIEIQEF